MERWIRISKIYEVSSSGRVRSIDRIVNAKLGSKKRTAGRILKQVVSSEGYGMVNVGGLNSVSVHRLIAGAFIPNSNGLPCVNHKNGIKTDNRIENLEWVTYSDNTKHSYKIGLQKPQRGTAHVNAVLDDLSVRVIREAYELNMGTQSQIAKYFGISQQHVSDIINKRRWTHSI